MVLGALGKRETDDGSATRVVPAAEPECTASRRTTWSILLRATAVAIIATAVVWWI